MTADRRAFKLVADDVLFFRDGRPNTQGDDHYLRSIFPPFPSTLYGAVRTRRLTDEGVPLSRLNASAWAALPAPLRAEIGEWGAFGSLRLRGPWLVRGDEILLPAPADLGLVFRADEASGGNASDDRRVGGRRADGRRADSIERVTRMRFEASSGSQEWSHPLALAVPHFRDGESWRPVDGAAPESVEGWFLTAAGMDAWRRGGAPAPNDFVHASELWVDELRTGVGLEEAQRTARKGYLYTFGFVRLRPGVALGFDVAGGALEPGGHVRLGGESRTARLEAGPAFPFDAAPEGAAGRFALCFLTPALSESGSYPPGFSETRLDGRVGGVPCRLEGAASRAPRLVGGWDLARNYPKPLRREVAPGSVFVFRADGGDTLPGAAELSDFAEESVAQQGFGLAISGLALQER